MPAKGKVLEIGCSKGYFLRELKNKGFDVVGIVPNALDRKHAKDN